MTNVILTNVVLIYSEPGDSNLIFRKAVLKDLSSITALLIDDELGWQRENTNEVLDPNYTIAFHKIIADSNQYLMVIEKDLSVIGTCHLTIMLSLTLIGSTRMNIEAVRIDKQHGGHSSKKYSQVNPVINKQARTKSQKFL